MSSFVDSGVGLDDAVWPNLQIEKFVNRMLLYITCEKSRGPHLAEPGFTAGGQAGWLMKFGRGLKFQKLAVDQNIPFSAFKVVHCFSNFDAFIMLFPGKHFYKVVL